MRIYELLRGKGFHVITVRPGTPVTEVLNLLKEYNLGAVVVSTDGREVAGIVTERDIVRRLADGSATVLELAEPFPISLPAISRHLKVLEQAGLISRGRDGQRRPCQLRPEPLVEIAAWAEHTRAAWEHRLDRLDAHLRRTSDRTASTPTLEKP